MILTVGTWRTVFAVLTAVGLAMLAAVAVGIPETLPPEHRHGNGLASTSPGWSTCCTTAASWDT